MSALQVVVLSQVLADETTLGYEDQCNLRLLKFNQQPVRNLRHLADMVYHCKEGYMRFDLEYVCPALSYFLRLSLSCCWGVLINMEWMSVLFCLGCSKSTVSDSENLRSAATASNQNGR